MNARFSIKTLIVTTVCTAVFLAIFLRFASGVTVTVRNTGSSQLIDLEVHVTGRSYHLGDLPGGTIKQCKASPTSESHVEITYRLSDGTTKRHVLDCYFEPGYRGTVEAEIQDGELIRSSHRIPLWSF